MSELTRRVLFSVIAAPLALAIIFIGDAALAGLLGILAALAAWEYCRIARGAGADPIEWLCITLAALCPLAVHATYLGVVRIAPSAVALAVLLPLAVAIWARWPGGRPLASAAATVFGAAYAGGMLSFGYVLRYHPYAVGAAAGTAVVMLPLVLTWVSDIGAYFVGRGLGKRKLIPAVSPGKTVAGAVGALVLTAIAAWAYARWLLPPAAQLTMRAVEAIGFGLIVSVVAQVGDLAESLLKREGGVKDSSHLLPGHGGILDRFDSLLFVLPTATLLLGAWLDPAFR